MPVVHAVLVVLGVLTNLVSAFTAHFLCSLLQVLSISRQNHQD